MSDTIIITSIRQKNDNRKLETNSNGYTLMPLGAINVFNSAGQYYIADNSVVNILTSTSSALMRRVKSGSLRGEVGHPKYIPGMSESDFFIRNLKIYEDNVCLHISEIILKPTTNNSGFGNDKVIEIWGWVKASGPKADAFERAVNNDLENLALSIRSTTSNSIVNGVIVKRITQIITWDLVNEPGIAVATKWKGLGVESIDSQDIIQLELSSVANTNNTIQECLNCSLESGSEVDMVDELIRNTRSENIFRKW